MSFYRERFGHRDGEFPVGEDVARRSLALPFFPQLTEGQVARSRSVAAWCIIGAHQRRRAGTSTGSERRERPARGRGGASSLAACLPVVLWHRAIAMIAEDFRFELDYLVTGWTGYALIVARPPLPRCPCVLSIGRRPDSRLYPRSRGAFAGWGVCSTCSGSCSPSRWRRSRTGVAAPRPSRTAA